MNKKHQIILVTTSLCLIDNFIQYNIAKKESGENKGKVFVFPPLKTALKMTACAGIIALLSSLIVGDIKN
jgi:hypothetical protein